MKNTTLLLLIVALTFSCKQEKKTNDYSNETLDVTATIYPESISKIFYTHGRIEVWNSMQTLAFTMSKANGDEVTTTNLKTRKSLIDMPKHQIGFDGKDVWLHKKDTTTYKGNPKFYYNLMFYFYAMPFVLADDGITYKTAEPLIFEGKEYPGIHISYDSGIGESPEDEYILFYDSDTNKMAWLAYTVTFFSKSKSKEFHLIKYDAWQEVNGLLLPKTFKWYGFEGNIVGDYQREMDFVNVSISKEKPEDNLFKNPEIAKTIE
jgi:hypothetical protein